MDSKMNFEVGDTVRVFTVEEVEAFVEAGGDDYCLLKCERYIHDTAFGKVRKVVYVDEDGSVELECEYGEHNYFYPPEILELVKEGEPSQMFYDFENTLKEGEPSQMFYDFENTLKDLKKQLELSKEWDCYYMENSELVFTSVTPELENIISNLYKIIEKLN